MADSDSSSVEILPSKQHFKKLIMKTTCAQEQKRVKNQTSFQTTKAPTEAEKAEPVYVHSQDRKSIKKNKKFTKGEEEKIKAMERANSNFRSENPSFRMVMQPSYVHSSAAAPVIPSKFAKQYLDGNGDAILEVLDDTRRWPIEYYTLAKSAYEVTRIRNFGWRKFRQDNHLQIGDVCVFELFLLEKTLFKVTISKSSTLPAERPRVNLGTFTMKKAAVSNEAKGKAVCVQSEERKRIHSSTLTSSKNKLTKFEKIKAVERPISNFRPDDDNPFFEIVMQPSYVQTSNVQTPAIPSNFAKKYDLEDRINDLAKLKMSGGKNWRIELYISSSSEYGEIRIKSSGWRKFVKDNHLQVGDVCIFELLLGYVDVTTFRVVVSRYSALPAANGQTSKDKASCSKAPTEPSPDHPKRRRVESSSDVIEKNQTKKKMKVSNRDCSSSRARSNSGNPTTFDVLMKAAHFRNNYIYYLNLPMKIVKNMEQGNHKVTLQIGNKLWRVMLNIYPKLGTFGKGWFEFAKENKLKVGDVCTFELIERQILRMRVSIARN